jgi:putative Ca2+/H+ antiporter (TMEM165/GDT1 family)
MGVAAFAEMFDKSQLLAVVLAARLRAPSAIIAGILAAALMNHAAAATLGLYLSRWVTLDTIQMLVGVTLMAMSPWTLIPEREGAGARAQSWIEVFLSASAAFFVVELGDKSQMAATLLARHFQDIRLVTVGTALGVLAASAPLVLMSHRLGGYAISKRVRAGSALVFLLAGAAFVCAALTDS